MRQILFATNKVTSGLVTAASAGYVGIAKQDAAGMTFIANLAALNDPSMPYLDNAIQNQLNLVLVRDAADGGNVVLPFHPNHFDWVKAAYQAATTFEASLTVPAPDSEYYDYTIIAVKKGMKFNERNKWTATVRVKSTDTAATLAEKLAAYFNANVDGLGLNVTVGGDDNDTLTFTATEAGVDYQIVPADDLTGTTVTYTTRGKEALGDAKYIIDLANKAAADAGFEYTYEEADLYPKHPFNPLASANGEDPGYNIYTLRFAEPRDVKTRDEVVHQIVQIIVPSTVSLDSLFAVTAG